MATHPQSQSMLATKREVEANDEYYMGFSGDYFEYDIFGCTFTDEAKTSVNFSHLYCDNSKVESFGEQIVRYSDYEDGNYHLATCLDTVPDGVIKTSVKYTYTKKDEFENWTERIGEVSQDYPRLSETQNYTITETRKISYYEKGDLDFDNIKTAVKSGKTVSTNRDVYDEISNVLHLAKNQLHEEESEMIQESSDEQYNSGTVDITALTRGWWHFQDYGGELGLWYSFQSDGTGKLRVDYSDLYIPVMSFTWTIHNGNLAVRWNSDMTALARVNGWNGEILSVR